MTSISLPRIPGQGKSAAWLSGARGPPRASGQGLRVLVVGAQPTVLQPTGVPSVIETRSRTLHHVSTVLGKCLACGPYPMVLSPATILIAPHQRRRHGNTRARSWTHVGQGAATR